MEDGYMNYSGSEDFYTFLDKYSSRQSAFNPECDIAGFTIAPVKRDGYYTPMQIGRTYARIEGATLTIHADSDGTHISYGRHTEVVQYTHLGIAYSKNYNG